MRVLVIMLALVCCGSPPPTKPHRPHAAPDHVRLEPQIGHDFSERPTLHVSPDGRYLATAAKLAMVWDLETGKIVRTFVSGTGQPMADARFVGRRDVLVVDKVGAWVVYDAITGEKRRALATTSTRPVFVSPDATRLAAYDADKPRELEVRDLATGAKLAEIHSDAPILSRAFSPDARTLALGLDRKISLYDTTSGQLTKTLVAAGPCQGVAFTSDGTRVFAHDGDQVEWLWDLATGTPRTLPEHADYDKGRTRTMVAGDRMLVAEGVELHLVDVGSGRILKKFPAIDGERTTQTSSDTTWAPVVTLVPDGTRLVTYLRGAVVVFEVATGRELHRFATASPRPQRSLAFSSDGKRLVTSGENVYVWDLSSLRLDTTIPWYVNSAIAFASGDKILALREMVRSTVVWFDAAAGRQLGELVFPNDTELSLLPDGSAVEVTTPRTITRHDPRTRRVLWSHRQPNGNRIISRPSGGHASPRRTRAIIYTDEVEEIGVEIFDLDETGWTSLKTFEIGSKLREVWLGPDDKYVLLAGRDHTLESWDVARGAMVARLPVVADVTSAVFLSSDRAIVGLQDGTVEVWDLATGQRQWTRSLHGLDVTDLAVSPDGRLAASTSHDTVRLWRIDTGVSIAIVAAGDDWVMYGEDGIFDASQDGDALVAAIDGERTYQVGQLAARNNRPDLLLERMGLGDPDTIAHLRARHERRLERLHLDKEALASTFSDAPRVEIIETKQARKSLAITFDVTATDALRTYQIWANGVPLLGIDGKPARGTKLHATETIELTSGLNRIEVAAVDRYGRESLRVSSMVRYTGKTVGDLYYLAFGVSNYKNPAYNLQYAHKDVTDLGDVLRGATNYAHVHTKILTDREVTVDGLRAAKKFLTAAKVDDTVIVFVAGHGMHTRDRTADYYFATYEVDVDKLTTTAAPFEVIEDLVQGIAPRRKLLLLDTCESGSADPETSGGSSFPHATATATKLRSRALVRTKPGGTAVPPLRVVLDRKRYIYNDLVHRSGAIVLSSSRGTEASFELDEMANGVFTETMLRLLTTDERRTSMPIQRFAGELAEAVPKSTENLQHPSTDRNNADVEIDIPMVPGARGIIDRR